MCGHYVGSGRRDEYVAMLCVVVLGRYQPYSLRAEQSRAAQNYDHSVVNKRKEGVKAYQGSENLSNAASKVMVVGQLGDRASRSAATAVMMDGGVGRQKALDAAAEDA